MIKALIASLIVLLVVAVPAVAVTIQTEVHEYSGTVTTVVNGNGKKALTVVQSYTGAITEQDTYPDQVTVTETVTVTTTPPPPGDTTPPSDPSNLRFANVAQTSLDLLWDASTDNVAIDYYRVSQGGNTVNVSGLSRSYTGLTCNTAYTFSVQAVDTSGNVSSVVSASRTTAACDTPPPSGTILPGQSWQAAYDAAASGSTLTVAAGNHGSPSLVGSKTITFLGENGAVVSKMPSNAVNVTYNNIDIDTGSAHGQYTASEPRGAITWRNVDVRGLYASIHVWNPGFRWYGGSIIAPGTRTCSAFDGQPLWLNAGDVVVDGVTFGAFDSGSAGCSDGNFHQEAIRVQCSHDVKIRNVTFTQGSDTGSGHIFVTCSSGGQTVSGLEISNSVFPPLVGTYAIQAHSNVATYSNWTIKNNRFDQPLLLPGNFSGLVACGNTGQVPSSWQVSCDGTPPPPSGSALYVSPNGSDTSDCKSSLAPCRTFARVATVAVGGETIEVMAGNHGVQKFAGGYGSTQGQINKVLNFHGQPGNIVRQINVGGGTGRFTFDGINIDATGPKLTGAAFENGGREVTFKNGEIGNVTDEKGALVTENGIVFDAVRFHDVVIATSGVHSECVFAAVPEGMIVRNSTFTNCAVMDIFFVWPDWWSPAPPAYGNVVLEGNQFGDPTGSCCGIYVGGTGPSGDRTMRNWTVRNNFFGDGPAIAGQSGGIYCGNTGAAPAAWETPCSSALFSTRRVASSEFKSGSVHPVPERIYQSLKK
jgi:chitodextrinase